MIAEILSTGDEIRSGAVTDTNAAHIALKLGEAGIAVVRHMCVGDDRAMLRNAIAEISKRADIAVVTGGLGPTMDDITALAAAGAAGVGLTLDEGALKNIETFFLSRNREVSPSNRKQAFLPEGSTPINNPVGTAPGFVMKIGQCTFFFLPGVPFEMERMLEDSVVPQILVRCGKNRSFCRVKNISTFGLPESVVNERLAGFDAAFPDLTLGLRAIFPEIHVKIYGSAMAEDLLDQRIAEASNWINDQMGRYLLSPEGLGMAAVVGGLLCERKETLAVAESCTGGLVSHQLTNVPGSSDYFLFSAVTYSNASKVKVLGVPKEILETYGAVHEKTAEQMAMGARRLAGSTYGISTTGIAGPDGGTEEKPVGTVCIGIAGPNTSKAMRYCLPFGQRLRNKEIFAAMAMDVLRRTLLDD
jgi:nicotinamide-nucleotide amidase